MLSIPDCTSTDVHTIDRFMRLPEHYHTPTLTIRPKLCHILSLPFTHSISALRLVRAILAVA